MKVCILGGGLIGLAVALQLRQRGAAVLVVDRGYRPAGWAAAGMIAPLAEGLSTGAFAELALKSRALWPLWADKLEYQSGCAVDYTPCGALLPELTEPTEPRPEHWWSPAAIRAQLAPVGPAVRGGVWLAEEACVDNRKVLEALQVACQRAGVEVRSPVTVYGPADPQLQAVSTSLGPLTADAFVLAQGAWSGEWLELPVRPLKGQMLALQAEPGFLKTIVFGHGIYLVPRADGRIIVGATQEWVGFAPDNTAGGMAELLTDALRLVPGLAGCQLIEQWWGYRPATPDTAPILGPGPWPHLFFATGHHRNGVLLAPITAELVSRAVFGDRDPLLAAFDWRRFS